VAPNRKIEKHQYVLAIVISPVASMKFVSFGGYFPNPPLPQKA
jgi:hypothetical protein